jgi:uncharacterized protein YegL
MIAYLDKALSQDEIDALILGPVSPASQSPELPAVVNGWLNRVEIHLVDVGRLTAGELDRWLRFAEKPQPPAPLSPPVSLSPLPQPPLTSPQIPAPPMPAPPPPAGPDPSQAPQSPWSIRRGGAAQDSIPARRGRDYLGDYYDDDDSGVRRRAPADQAYSASPQDAYLGAYSWGGGSYRQSAGIPVRDQQGPLPRDGLFIRRNNAFGTRSALGLPDLIDQGVLIDQAQIRFDDFVASNTEQIPGPAPGAAIAVSHGAAAVTGHFKAHEQTTHFLEIALKAAGEPPQGRERPAPLPVNFVFVVDTSASMSGAKLDSVRTAIRELYAQLRDNDVLGLVTFDSQVRTLLRATPKRQLPAESLTRLVSGLQASGGTDINLGIRYGIDEIRRHSDGGGDYVNCIYLFSDGDPTSGETNWIRIRADIASRIRGDITLSCFGFGSDARMRELDALAGLTGGHSTFVIRPDDVALNLAEDLTRRDHLAAINVQLKIDLSPDAVLWHFYGHDLITDPAARAAVEQDARMARNRAREDYGVDSLPDLISGETGVRIFTPDLAFGETYWIVFELQMPATMPPGGFGTATVQYLDTLARENRRHEFDLTEAGTIPAEAVLAHAVGLRTSEITFYALDDLYQNDRETAKTRLSNHIQILEAAYRYQPVAQFRDDQVTVRKLMSLAANLGQPFRLAEDIASPFGTTIFAMSQFGQVRSGYVTSRRFGAV